ncbi:hypothetical protein VZ95_17985 [Elstera litoralis]|uniref:Rap1a immunity protein domain-containing protein n=1 Tax=Elstera litoralis TaxID=552518 RepID=A0A0F3IS40_9PROT|nr:hypothetical protein [Elstera litoralis]KJV08409.1 hypothetical protein VZ95_17985 [Elstera litoralis]
MRTLLLVAGLAFAAAQADAQAVKLPYSLELDGLHRLGAQCDAQTPAGPGCAQVYADLARFYGSQEAYAAALRPMSEPDLNAAHGRAVSCDANPPAADPIPCATTYARLVRHYGSYLAYIDAAQAWKGKRG